MIYAFKKLRTKIYGLQCKAKNKDEEQRPHAKIYGRSLIIE
jgi:hypothetical protein